MRRLSLAILASAAAFSSAAPASAQTFVSVGDSTLFQFNGTIPGTTASLLLALTGENNTLNTFTFSYTLTNTSNLAMNPTSRVRSFGFDDVGVDTFTASATTADSNGFDTIVFDDNFPNGLGDREFCLYRAGGSCIGGGTGATVGDPATGSFMLDYAGTGMTQITFENFAVRYQSTGLDSQGSGTGTRIITPPVPEPSTWAMMLIGFGAVGYGMRNRRRTTLQAA